MLQLVSVLVGFGNNRSRSRYRSVSVSQVVLIGVDVAVGLGLGLLHFSGLRDADCSSPCPFLVPMAYCVFLVCSMDSAYVA